MFGMYITDLAGEVSTGDGVIGANEPVYEVQHPFDMNAPGLWPGAFVSNS